VLPCPVGALNIASFMLQNDEPFLFIHICSIRNRVILILLLIFDALERELFSYCFQILCKQSQRRRKTISDNVGNMSGPLVTSAAGWIWCLGSTLVALQMMYDTMKSIGKKNSFWLWICK